MVTKSAICLVQWGARMPQWWEHRLPPLWPGFKSQYQCHMWVEFVVGSLAFSERFFSGYSCFPLSSKTNISKFQFDQEPGRRRTTMWMCYLQIVMIFIYLVSLSELSSPADRLLSTGQGLVPNCCQLLKICTTGSPRVRRKEEKSITSIKRRWQKSHGKYFKGKHK